MILRFLESESRRFSVSVPETELFWPGTENNSGLDSRFLNRGKKNCKINSVRLCHIENHHIYDFSILEISDGVFEVLATSGDTF